MLHLKLLSVPLIGHGRIDEIEMAVAAAESVHRSRERDLAQLLVDGEESPEGLDALRAAVDAYAESIDMLKQRLTEIKFELDRDDAECKRADTLNHEIAEAKSAFAVWGVGQRRHRTGRRREVPPLRARSDA